MEEENNLPNFEEQQSPDFGGDSLSEPAAPKKRRGRKPKAEPLGGAAAENPEPAPLRRRRGRPSKKELLERERELAGQQAPQDFEGTPRGDSEYSAPDSGESFAERDGDDEGDFESYSRANRELESNKRNDEFSFLADSQYSDEPSADDSSDDSDSEIPEHFTTDESDLIGDSYRGEDSAPQEPGGEDSDFSEEGGEPSEEPQNAEKPDASGVEGGAGQRRPNGRNRPDRREFFRNRPQANFQSRRQNQQNFQHSQNPQNRAQRAAAKNQPRQNPQNNKQGSKFIKFGDRRAEEQFNPEFYLDLPELKSDEGLAALAEKISEGSQTLDYSEVWGLGKREFGEYLDEKSVPRDAFGGLEAMFKSYLKHAAGSGAALRVKGILDVFGGGKGGALCFSSDGYRLKKFSVYVPQRLIDKNGLLRGCEVEALALAPLEGWKADCPLAVKVLSVMGMEAEKAMALTPFNELTPYYPTRRIILETDASASWDNLSMRVVDLLAPIGFGQRALIVAPPRTGKTVLMQGMAKSIRKNAPDAHLMVLLVDERPEEVTDFKRSVDAEVVASTFDEDAFSHVHAAEMVISKARRMVEAGKDVVILLDSITRLARAYNALMPNGGRTMSGGVEANALQKPKRFFGSARNIEGGGSLTIIATALIETGSKMDEVIFEEFKGTGNLELHLDRALAEKRIFPAINIEKSGTRKEELLYHPDEMAKIYMLRRSMKGVPIVDSMELLIQRLKKLKTNVEFLLGINR